MERVVLHVERVATEATAMSAARAWGGSVDVLRVGDERNWYAHANLFIANDAREVVFNPMIAWISRNLPRISD